MGAQPERSNRVVPIWTRREKDSVMQHMTNTDKRLMALEGVAADVTDIAKNVSKIWRSLKIALPSIISALAAAGYVSGDIGKIATAIFGGM